MNPFWFARIIASVVPIAACRDQIQALKYLCERYDLMARDMGQDLFIFIGEAIEDAAENDGVKVLEYLCERYDLMASDMDEDLPIDGAIETAAANDRIKALDYLCKRYDPAANNMDKRLCINEAIKIAARCGEVKALDYFFKRYDITANNVALGLPTIKEILFNAIAMGTVESVKYLCEYYNHPDAAQNLGIAKALRYLAKVFLHRHSDNALMERQQLEIEAYLFQKYCDDIEVAQVITAKELKNKIKSAVAEYIR